jgi:hypothetical protein
VGQVPNISPNFGLLVFCSWVKFTKLFINVKRSHVRHPPCEFDTPCK